MKTKIWKSMMSGTLGAALSGISLYGMNPVGMAAFGAIRGSSLSTVPTIPLFLIIIYIKYGFLNTFKYAIMMFLVTAFIVSMKYVSENKKRVNVYLTGLATAMAYGMMESADVFMSRHSSYDYAIVGVSTLLVFSLTVVFGKLIEIILGEDRIKYTHRMKRKEAERSREEKRAVNYEEKIRLMADSFEKMAKSIVEFQENDGRCRQYPGEAGLVNEIWRKKLVESRNAVALQLKEMSGILKEVTAETYAFVNVDEQKERKIRKRLKAVGVRMKNIVILNNRRGIDEVNIILRATRKRVTLKDVGDIISDVLGKEVSFRKNPYVQVSNEYTMYNFVEDPNFYIIHGTAKQSRDEEMVSGDNFTCMELDSGQTLLSVSDGMGHGWKAYKESETVLELLEEMMESGFSEETAIRLINSVFLIDSDVINPAALDMGIIDMYSGVCDFMKLGASSTFVKRGNWVEAIKSTSLPIGSMERVDIETTSKKLYDGDFVIMMSDGIIDSIPEEDKEKTIGEIILGIKEGKPEEMAKEILKKALSFSGCQKTDDMMVMVTGIWDRCA